MFYQAIQYRQKYFSHKLVIDGQIDLVSIF